MTSLMRLKIIRLPPSWPRASYSTNVVPPPRPYKPAASSERVSRRSDDTPEPATTKKKTIIQRLFSLKNDDAPPIVKTEAPDIERGRAATLRVIKEGVLDPKYKAASRRVVALICALPFVIVIGLELYRRRFLGKERRAIPMKQEEHEVEVKTESKPT